MPIAQVCADSRGGFSYYAAFLEHPAARQVIADKLGFLHVGQKRSGGIRGLYDVRKIQIVTPQKAPHKIVRALSRQTE